MKFLLPLLLALVGLGAGVGAGVYLQPAEPDHGPEQGSDPASGHTSDGDAGDAAHDAAPSGGAEGAADESEEPGDGEEADYVKLNNQFIVPLVNGGRVTSLVVMSLSLEVRPGSEEAIYAREPKLRDAFLRVLFDHANAGGFSGDFMQPTNMMVLRDSLVEIARKSLGDIVLDILITDLVRQDT